MNSDSSEKAEQALNLLVSFEHMTTRPEIPNQNSGIALTPDPPYYAVIFTSLQTNDIDGYDEMSARMVELGAEQDGFLGIESARDGLGITVCYWRDEESIRRWRENVEHRLAQEEGFRRWYASFATRVCRVERQHIFER